METFQTFVGRERKGQAVFLPLVLLRGRGGRAKLQWKDFTDGPAKRFRPGRIGVEGCPISAGAGRTESMSGKQRFML